MNQMSISLKIRVMIIACLLPTCVVGAEKQVKNSLEVTNACDKDIEVVCLFATLDEDPRTAPLGSKKISKGEIGGLAGSKKIPKGEMGKLPVATSSIAVKIGPLCTNYLKIEDKTIPLLIMQPRDSNNFVVYQQGFSPRLLVVKQTEKKESCILF
jgi:hypothetical protein